MGQSDGKHHPLYSLSAIGSAQDQLDGILERAAMAGTHIAAMAALDAIESRLRRDPRHFGEPLYHLRKLRMTVRCVALAPLHVVYGVHDVEPVVVIRRFASMATGAV